jgi:hypothetical protein
MDFMCYHVPEVCHDFGGLLIYNKELDGCIFTNLELPVVRVDGRRKMK